MVLVAVEGVEVEVDVVHHADAAEPVADVAALGPQHRLVLVVWVVRHQLHRVALALRVLDGLAGDPVHERERRVPFLVLDAVAVPHVLDPVLVLVARVRRRQAHAAVADGHAEPVVRLAVDADRRLAVAVRRVGGGAAAAAGVGLVAPGEDLPALVVALGPLPQHHGGAVVHAAVVLVAVEGVEVEPDVVHHADAAEALANVAALRPQHRLVLVLRVERHQLHLKTKKIR